MHFTKSEQIILDCLKPMETVSVDEIANALYGDGGSPEGNSIQVLMSRIRKKLGNNSIKTIRGKGYMLISEANS